MEGSEEGAVPMDLHEKLEQIEASKRRLTARRATNIGKALCLSALNECRNASLPRHITPAFVADKRRRRQEQAEEARQTEIRRRTQVALDEQVEAARIRRRQTLQSELRARRRITQSAPTVQRFHALRDLHRVEEVSRRRADRDGRNEAQRREMERRRNEAEVAESKRLAEAERRRRQEAASYWSERAKSTRTEADAILAKRRGTKEVRSLGIVEVSLNPVATKQKKSILLNHPDKTMLQEQRASSRIEGANVDNRYLPLLSTKQSYREELIRAKLTEVGATKGRYLDKLSSLESSIQQNLAKKEELATKRRFLQLSIELHERIIQRILAGLEMPYHREPNATQKEDLHQLKSGIAQAKGDIDRVSATLNILSKQTQILKECVASMRSSGVIEKIECSEKALLSQLSSCPPMVLGRELDQCSNLGDNPTSSGMVGTIIARSELELQRNGLASSQTDRTKRRSERAQRDIARRQEDYLQDLITHRACEVEDLRNALTKKKRVALNKEIVAGRRLREETREEATSLPRTIDHDQLRRISITEFARRKLARFESDRIAPAQRGLIVGDEHCIYDSNSPNGVHQLRLCHGKSSDDGTSDPEYNPMRDRIDQKQRKASYDDTVDFIGRIQGFRKKLASLEAARTELRGRYAAAVEANIDSEMNAAKQTLLEISEEINAKRNAQKALERKYRRAQRLMLRRSILAKDFFPRWRNETLATSLRRWMYYAQCSKTIKEAFRRKHCVLMKDLQQNQENIGIPTLLYR